MFNLETSITNWRTQMLAAGLWDATALDELEGHLRDDIELQIRTGRSVEDAFTRATQQIGQAPHLRTEFAKTGETLWEQIRHILFIHLPLPKLQFANHTNMNTTSSNSEPRWATYSKTVTFIMPALMIWIATTLFVLPKLRQICQVSGTVAPKPMLFILDVSDLFKNYLFVSIIVFFCVLMLLEWRSRTWARHRRLIFGVAAFTLNSAVLIAVTAMFILAVLAGSRLLPHT